MSRATVDVRNATAEDVDAHVERYRWAHRNNAEMGFPSSVLDCDDEPHQHAARVHVARTSGA